MAFQDNFPTIYAEMQNQGIDNNIKKVFMSNVNLNENYNMDTTLYAATTSSSDTITVVGDYTYFEGYVVIGDEILYLNSPVMVGSNTRFNSQRGRKFTRAFSHSAGDTVRDIYEVECENYSYSQKTTSSSNSIFAPVLSSGTFVFNDDVSRWIITSSVKEFKLAKNKPIYIFEGVGKEIKCEFLGFIYDWDTDAKERSVTIMFKDEFTLVNAKTISQTTIYTNAYVVDIIADLLDCEIVYANGTNKEHYGKLDLITTADYDTYGDMLSYICEAKCMRMSYDNYGRVKVYSDLFKTADTYDTNLEVTDRWDLVDINETTENTLILNTFNCEFKDRYTKYNRNQFMDGSTFKMLNFRKKLLNQSIVLLSSQGFKDFTLDFGNDIEYITIGTYVMLKNNSNGDEFVCRVFEIDGTTASLIGGFDRDRQWNLRGKNSYLISRGYTSSKTFTVYYSSLEMDTIFALNVENADSENISSNLKIPILPQETVHYTCEFGNFESNNVEFSGIVEEIDGIYGTFTGGTDLYYLKDYEQGFSGVPIYMISNRMTLSGSGNSELYYYSTFNNSGVEVAIDKATDNESNIELYLTNTLSYIAPLSYTPQSTVGRILKVSDYSLYHTGDVLKLNSENATFSETQQYYNLYSDVKWIIESKFRDSSGDYIVLDKSYPIGDDNIQMKFDKYTYSNVIHLNEFRIKGNPVMQETRGITKINYDSVASYDTLEYTIDGKLTTLDDLKYSISYLYNNYAGLPSNYTRTIPFETFYRPDIELLDVVKIYEKNIVSMVGTEVIIIEKSVKLSGTSREENCVGITKAQNLAELIDLDIDSQKNAYVTLSATTYNHNGNEGLESETDTNIDDKYVSKESTVGNISFLKIDTDTYYGKSQTTIRSGETSLTLSLYGDKSTYNVQIFKYGNKAVLLVGTEYLLVQSNTAVTSTSSSVNLTILQRDLFGTGTYEITSNQVVQICQILQYTDKDGMIIDGTITVGSTNGKIKFIESGIVLDDYATTIGTYDGIRFFKENDDTSSDDTDLLSINRDRNTGETNFKVNTNQNINKHFLVTLTENDYPDKTPSSLRVSTRYLGYGVKDVLKIDGLAIGDTAYYDYAGGLKYYGGHFYGYNGVSWVQLDNEDSSVASEVTLTNNGSSAPSSADGKLAYYNNNIYFYNSAVARWIPCLTQGAEYVSTLSYLKYYTKNYYCDVTTSGFIITIAYHASDARFIDKEFEVFHTAGDITTNNIIIQGAGMLLYAPGGTSLGYSYTMSTTGARVKIVPVNGRWYIYD